MRMKVRARWVAGGLLAFFIVVFIFQNTDVVTLRFLAWNVTMSRVLLFALILGVGMVLGWLLRSVWQQRGAAPRRE
jgi:uncharacterized integral membrane protein